jgi:hypothetical protein
MLGHRPSAGGATRVRLSGFILQHMDAILADWDAFARTLGPAAADMSPRALRDHARPILTAIAADMALPETPREQLEKSQGRQPMEVGSAAGTHGTLRHVSGFSLLQLTAEYRALRATVLRLWLPKVEHFDEDVSRDMVRFNETIDQALAESVLTYSEQGTRTRDTFLAILGHDLRSPLATVSMGGAVLAREYAPDTAVGAIALRLLRSAASMTTMVNDLLEYSRTQLGGAIPIESAVQDMAPGCGAAIVADPTPNVNATGLVTFHPDTGALVTSLAASPLKTDGFDLLAIAWKGDVLLVGDKRRASSGYPIHAFQRKPGTCELTPLPDRIFVAQKPIVLRTPD